MKRKLLFLCTLILSVSFLNACASEADSSQPEPISLDESSSDISEPETELTEILPETSEATVEESLVSESETSPIETETEQETEAETIPETIPERIPPDGELVRILDYIPDIVVDLRYATTNNFTGTVIYDDAEAYLCYGTVKKLAKVQEEVKERGFRIIIWDAYRPHEAQEKLWEVCPNPTYVANPKNGITGHSRGNTIDAGLVYEDGSEVKLPSEFDEFSLLADRDYSDVSEEAAENSQFLEGIMTRNGFKGYRGEWWDYSDVETYDLIIPDKS